MALSVPNSHHSGQGQFCLQVQTNRVHASPLLAAGNKTPQYLSLIQAKERKREALKGLKAILQPYKDLTKPVPNNHGCVHSSSLAPPQNFPARLNSGSFAGRAVQGVDLNGF